MNTRIESIVNLINELDQLNVEYQTEHQDAGDNYAHLPREGGFCYGNGETRLKEYLQQNFECSDFECSDFESIDFDELCEFVLDNFEMVSGNIYGYIGKNSSFTVVSFEVGEVENQIEINHLKNATGLNVTSKRLEIIKNHRGLDSHMGYIGGQSMLTYTNTDNVWYAAANENEILEYLTEEYPDLSIELK